MPPGPRTGSSRPWRFRGHGCSPSSGTQRTWQGNRRATTQSLNGSSRLRGTDGQLPLRPRRRRHLGGNGHVLVPNHAKTWCLRWRMSFPRDSTGCLGCALVAVVVSLTFPGMVGESYGIMRNFTRSVFDQLLESGARAILIDSAAARPAERAGGRGRGRGALLGWRGRRCRDYTDSWTRFRMHMGLIEGPTIFCIDMIHRTLGLDQPMLAICRGSQLFNVALGGTADPGHRSFHPSPGATGKPCFLTNK